MSSDALTLRPAAMLGFLHALEVDHLAVTTFVSRRRSLGSAGRFGLRWGLGHLVAVLLAGGAVLATGVRWPLRYDALGEALVGLMLVGLGLWALTAARKLHLHPMEEHGGHAHRHVHGSACRADPGDDDGPGRPRSEWQGRGGSVVDRGSGALIASPAPREGRGAR